MEKKIEWELKWENENSITLTESVDGGQAYTVLFAEENGHLAAIWPRIQKTLEVYFHNHLTMVGEEMKKGPE